jgi:hypothetical protein
MVNQNGKRCPTVPAPEKWTLPQPIGMGKDNELLRIREDRKCRWYVWCCGKVEARKSREERPGIEIAGGWRQHQRADWKGG